MNTLHTLIFSIFRSHRWLYVGAWFLALAIAVGRIENAHLCFHDFKKVGDPERRIDGNSGHTTIDFGGQWLLGRLLARGYGKDLYTFSRHVEVAERAYPRERAAPLAERRDSEIITQFYIHSAPDYNIGGPLYPPIHAFFMLPFALGEHPQEAYFAMQYVQMLFCFVAGLGVCFLSRGRIWWPVATAIILSFPGARGVIDLGQNSALTLSLLIWGWVLLSRSHPILGGCLWGIIAYKPVWSVSYFLVLILIRNWRAAGSMLATSAILVLLTIPFVGVQAWLNWLAIGQEAARIYNVDSNWVRLSRDLLSIPRRFLIDFELARSERENVAALAASWALWLLVFEISIRAFLASRKQIGNYIGPLPALVLLAAWLCTFHFMYYDSLISVFGIFVLLADPRAFFSRRILSLASVDQNDESGTHSKIQRSVWLLNSFVLTVVAILLIHENTTQILKIEVTGAVLALAQKHEVAENIYDYSPKLIIGSSDLYPWNTIMVLFLWFWCCLKATIQHSSANSNSATQPIQRQPDILSPHQ